MSQVGQGMSKLGQYEPAHVVPVPADALQRLFGARWSITFDHHRMIWMAERREGTALHVLAAHEPADLS